MPWVRIDENALDHPKFLATPDGALRLWLEGMMHCQKFLTDGYISDAVVRGLRAYSPKRRQALLSVGLWETSETGIRVHDYLQWNDSREHVMAARQHARDRIARLRGKKNGDGNGKRAPEVTPLQRENYMGGVVCSSPSGSSGEGGTGGTLSERAGNFCQWYEDTHQRLFKVGYMGAQKDYQKALELVEKFSDVDLRDAATFWFGQDDDFAKNGTRTISKFASRASDCLLRARRVVGVA